MIKEMIKEMFGSALKEDIIMLPLLVKKVEKAYCDKYGTDFSNYSQEHVYPCITQAIESRSSLNDAWVSIKLILKDVQIDKANLISIDTTIDALSYPVKSLPVVENSNTELMVKVSLSSYWGILSGIKEILSINIKERSFLDFSWEVC